jgi:hypothetical protein
MAQEIPNVEIFATGTWHGSGGKSTITEEDLDHIVESFEALGTQPGFKPVVKLGHADAQKWFGQKSGSPALGFISKVWRDGNKILANLSNVPETIVDMIKKGRYHSVSIELFPRYEHAGKAYRNVLYAIALLGAELPAVKGLKELAASLFHESAEGVVEYHQGEPKMSAVQYSQEQVDALVAAEVTKTETAIKESFEQKISAAETALEAAKAAQKSAEDALRTYEIESNKREITAIVEGAIKEGKLTPAQKDSMIEFGQSHRKAFDGFVAGLKVVVPTGEKGQDGEKKTFANASEEIDAKVKELQAKDGKLSYAEARHTVLSGNEDLKQRYFRGE